MGHKLSRVPVESPYRRQTTVTSDVDKTYQNTSTGQPLLTTTGAQTTHVTTSAATAGLLAALRWKKVTHQRRNRRSAAERANKTAYNAGISDMPQQAQSVASGNTGVWAKLFRHLSRKMTAGRRRQRVGRPNMYGVDHPDGSRSGALKGPATRAGGTSSVLPVSRNPVTSVIAYADNLGGDLPQHEKDSTDVNSNVADIVRRVSKILQVYIGHRKI
jgi:hypothetical protein